MPRQVWQVSDGGVFDTEAEALAWEDEVSTIEFLTVHVYQNTCGLSENDCREAATFIVAHYNVTPK